MKINSFVSYDYSIFDGSLNKVIRSGFLVIKLNGNLDEEIISLVDHKLIKLN